jgi:hypothetical protein
MKPDYVELTGEQAEFVAHAERLLASIPKSHRWKAAHCTVELSGGGPSWRGWWFGPHGHSGEFWLFGPNGERFSAAEILELNKLQLDAGYLQGRVNELTELTTPGSVAFTASEAQTLATAAAIIARRAPRPKARRGDNVLEIVPDAKAQTAAK